MDRDIYEGSIQNACMKLKMKRRSSKLSPLPQKMQNSDEKYLTVLETANRTAGEEVVNI